MGKLNGKRALITGGASGIGAEIVACFAAEGASIGILDLSGDAAEALTAKVAAEHGVAVASAMADVSDEAAAAAAIASIEAKIGATDILVNCAGIDNTGPLEEMRVETWDEMMAVHLRGSFLCIRAVLPGMKAQKWGRIINFSSQLAHKGAPSMVHYCAAKAGVIGMTRALAYEVGGDGITVNCINPGPIDTPLLRQIPQDWLDVKLGELPIKRFGRTSEVAPTALLLASEEGGYYLGASMNMNGGDYMI
ncbi:MAG: SDR family NAD(P)-dependent oxidoreductase [Pseudomonadota bacterium]